MEKDELHNFSIEPMSAARLEEYVDVFISVFTKEPWYDVYESRGQVETFFRNYMADDLFPRLGAHARRQMRRPLFRR